MRVERRTYLTPTHGALNVAHVLATHAALVVWFWLGARLPWVVFIPGSVFASLVHQRAMSEWAHEAAHGNLVATRRWNDLLADALTGVWLGLAITTYRATHLVHHDRDAFFLEGDADTYFLLVRSRREFWAAILGDVTGMTIVRQYLRFRPASEPRPGLPPLRRLVVTAAAQVLLIATLFQLGRLDAYVLYYGTLLLGYPLLNRLRTYGQHVTLADGRAQFVGSATSRTTDGGVLDRVLFTSPRLLYHHEHHRQPHLPYRALRVLCEPSDDVNRYSRRRWVVLRAVYAGLP